MAILLKTEEAQVESVRILFFSCSGCSWCMFEQVVLGGIRYQECLRLMENIQLHNTVSTDHVTCGCGRQEGVFLSLWMMPGCVATLLLKLSAIVLCTVYLAHFWFKNLSPNDVLVVWARFILSNFILKYLGPLKVVMGVKTAWREQKWATPTGWVNFPTRETSPLLWLLL